MRIPYILSVNSPVCPIDPDRDATMPRASRERPIPLRNQRNRQLDLPRRRVDAQTYVLRAGCQDDLREGFGARHHLEGHGLDDLAVRYPGGGGGGNGGEAEVGLQEADEAAVGQERVVVGLHHFADGVHGAGELGG